MSAPLAAAQPAADGTAGPRGQPRAALAAAALGFFAITLDALVVNVALPAIRNDLGGGITGLQWVVDGYTLMFAAPLSAVRGITERPSRLPPRVRDWRSGVRRRLGRVRPGTESGRAGGGAPRAGYWRLDHDTVVAGADPG
jgi:hypothetical protein